MLNGLRVAVALVVGLGVMSSAAAFDPVPAGDLQAQLSWGLAFGGASRTVQSTYAMALGYRGQADSPATSILQLDVRESGALASLAGLPLYGRSYRAEQTDSAEQPGYESTVEKKPWYARSWVMWTVGGLAATAALASGASSGDDDGGCANGNGCGVNCTNGDCTVPADENQGCVGEFCVTCSDGSIASECSPLLPTQALRAHGLEEIQRDEFDTDTGRMGDLVAR
jgi:hypothetical protein